MEHTPPTQTELTSKITSNGITFDDVLLQPRYSDFVPSQVDVSTQLTRRIRLNIPLLSSPMDTVTESRLAIALAAEGGLGVIHKNLTLAEQVLEVTRVKRSANGVIADPVTLGPDLTAEVARDQMLEHRVSGIPITQNGLSNGKVIGILTRRDLKFLPDLSVKISQVMTKDRLVTSKPGTTLKDAESILTVNKIEKLLLVDENYCLTGLITMRDVDKFQQYPDASRDARGRLRVAAAVGVMQFERIEALINADVDAIVVDTAHGHSKNVAQTVREVKKQFDIDVIAGNVATVQGTKHLIDAGVDAVKVGIGPGSICTTRIVSGVGVPQITAIMNGVQAAKDAGIPIIADGGIKHTGDVTKAIAAGASVVMLGSMFAGLDESPGETIIHMGRRFKSYRGMGSEGAMVKGSADRYGQKASAAKNKLVPEGVEGRVPYRGPLSDFVYQIVGGLRAGMGYCGSKTIDELRANATFCRITSASMTESHPHDIQITKESSNYTFE